MDKLEKLISELEKLDSNYNVTYSDIEKIYSNDRYGYLKAIDMMESLEEYNIVKSNYVFGLLKSGNDMINDALSSNKLELQEINKLEFEKINNVKKMKMLENDDKLYYLDFFGYEPADVDLLLDVLYTIRKKFNLYVSKHYS